MEKRRCPGRIVKPGLNPGVAGRAIRSHAKAFIAAKEMEVIDEKLGQKSGVSNRIDSTNCQTIVPGFQE